LTGLESIKSKEHIVVTKRTLKQRLAILILLVGLTVSVWGLIGVKLSELPQQDVSAAGLVEQTRVAVNWNSGAQTQIGNQQ
jgi:hypothetical protein